MMLEALASVAIYVSQASAQTERWDAFMAERQDVIISAFSPLLEEVATDRSVMLVIDHGYARGLKYKSVLLAAEDDQGRWRLQAVTGHPGTNACISPVLDLAPEYGELIDYLIGEAPVSERTADFGATCSHCSEYGLLLQRGQNQERVRRSSFGLLTASGRGKQADPFADRAVALIKTLGNLSPHDEMGAHFPGDRCVDLQTEK